MATWQTVHASFQQLAFDKATYDIREAHWIREGQATRVWDGVGCATFVEYLNMILGYRGNTARDRIRTALALAELPEIEDALAGGRICWSAARELTRVATPDTESAWLEAAEAQPVREIEDMVAGLERGDPPGAVPERGAERRILRFDVSGMTYALFKEASQAVTREAGRSLSDDEMIDLLARRVLEGPNDAGRASYQLAITRCSDCSRTFANAAGRQVQVDDAMVEAIGCDVQTVPVDGAWGGVSDAGGVMGAESANVQPAPATATHVGRASGDACREGRSECEGATRVGDHLEDACTQAQRGSARAIATHVGDEAIRAGDVATHVGDKVIQAGDVATHVGDKVIQAGNVATHVADMATQTGHTETLLGETEAEAGEMKAHVGDTETQLGEMEDSARPGTGAAAHSEAPDRATQTIPPRTRRAVMRAYHNRCAAPGCRLALYLDIHHIRLRSEAGGHSFDNLLPLCSPHHRAAHEGRLLIEQTERGPRFRHPDGTPYGNATGVNPAFADARSRVFQRLLELGFAHGPASAALAALGPSDSYADLMRAAIDELEK